MMGLLRHIATLLFLSAGLPSALASPIGQDLETLYPGGKQISLTEVRADSHWLANIKHRGAAPYNGNPSGYKVFRNVMDYGAKGDGKTDDTAAINAAVTDPGSRCGKGCDSSTTSPAIVYFPPGTYLISTPIIQYYYTQLVGSPSNIPTLKAAGNFQGIALIDSNPYMDGGANWFTNQNNFFKAVRNFNIDLTGGPGAGCTGIHWQVAQATSLINIKFTMGANTKHQGIFMENGSGGWLSDLSFSGGNIGMTIGNQQFTSRNLKFEGCKTAVNMLWDWTWTFKSLDISNCDIGIDLTNGGNQDNNNIMVGSAMLLDSKFTNVRTGIKLGKTPSSSPRNSNSFIIDNLRCQNVDWIVTSPDGSVKLEGSKGEKIVPIWGTGVEYTSGAASDSFSRRVFSDSQTYAASKPAVLCNAGSKAIYERSRPQYENVAIGNVVSAKANGCVGNGKADDRNCLQKLIDSSASQNKVLFLDHGIYMVSGTLLIPNNAKIVGEAWSIIMGYGPVFQNRNAPQAVLKVGNKDNSGCVELSDLVIETQGYAPGAIGIQWNMKQGKQGCNGMWDVHVRIGGSAGTNQSSDTCSKSPEKPVDSPPQTCITGFMLMHIPPGGSVYMENNWLWTSDHDLDRPDHNQINLYNGRGLLVEGQGPVWLYGTAAEHNQLYNYQFYNAANVWAGVIQTETPYMQPNPISTKVFPPDARWKDPTFSNCNGDPKCLMAWGVRVVDSKDILIYGAGLYSFFYNYGQTCIKGRECQRSMVSFEGKNTNVVLYNVNTIGTANMAVSNSYVVALGVNNPGPYGDVVAVIAKKT